MDNSDLENLFSDNNEENDDKTQETPAPENKITPELTNEQKALILKRWNELPENPPSIEELCALAYPDKSGLKGSHKEGRLIKKFLAQHELTPKTKTFYEQKGLLPLTDEMKEYVRVNTNMKASEIACALFDKPYFSNNSQEIRTIAAYQKELEASGAYKKSLPDGEEETCEEYRPPKTMDHVCARINRNVDGANYDSKKLTPTHKKQCLMLISYLHSFRFAHNYNLINNATDRRLLENTFIKYVFNKPDLTQEDLDQYLALANEAVTESSIKRTISMLEKEQETSLNETNKISMTIVEAIKTSRDEYNACRTRQDKLYKALELERSKRFNERVGPQFTLLNIIEAMKNEERRKAIVLEAEKRNDKLKEEIKRLSGLDSIICEIYGTDEDLIING